MSYYRIGFIAYDSNYLEHHGIKGQKWGIRRYQNEDGTLTEEGKKRNRQIDSSHYKEKKIGNKTLKVFDSENYRKAQEELESRLGKEAFDYINEKWNSTLDDVYTDKFTSFSKDKRKEIQNGLKRFNELNENVQQLYNKIYAEEIGKRAPSKIKEFFESEGAKERRRLDARETSEDRMRKTEDYKKLSKEINDIIEKREKDAGHYKDISMNEILRKLPASKRKDAYELMRFYWWDSD